MSLLQPVPLIVKDIEETRMIRLMYHGKKRIFEPHDYGTLNGSVRYLAGRLPVSAAARYTPLFRWSLLQAPGKVIRPKLKNVATFRERRWRRHGIKRWCRVCTGNRASSALLLGQ
jgi:hypothetical protein